MKKFILSILLVVFLFPAAVLSAPTQDSDEEKKSAVHISFIPPLSTNGIKASQYTNSLSFNLLAGVSKNEKAFTLGGLANVIGNNSNGFQLAGLCNYVGNEGRGVLFSGLVNVVKNSYSGMQFAGLVNIAEDVSGVQFAGLLNIANRSDYPIGLINIIKEGEMGVSLSYNEIGSTSIAFRSGGKVTYGILGLGYNHKTKGNAFTSIGGLGAHINIASWLRINNELIVESVGCFSDETTFKAGYALMPAFRLGRHFELFGGPSINYMQSDDMNNQKLFPSHSLWEKKGSSKMQQLYIGYQIGIHCIF